MLQKLSIYFFVALYMIAMLRPIAPFVEYAINYDYISKVLCINKDKPELNCNGKCQLMMELEKQQDDDFKSLRISMEEYPIGFVSILNIDLEEKQLIKEKGTFSYKKNYHYLFNKEVFHPPIA
ncbi:hypothetical protein [Tenacibaculum gallaicum]|nr:hypothetical protein [Tenacibaculum gallaicum]